MKIDFNESQQAANQAFLEFVRQVETAQIHGLVGFEATPVHSGEAEGRSYLRASLERETEVTYRVREGQFPRTITIHLVKVHSYWDAWKLIDDRYPRPTIHVRMPYHIYLPMGGSTRQFLPIRVSEVAEENCQVTYTKIRNMRTQLLEEKIKELR